MTRMSASGATGSRTSDEIAKLRALLKGIRSAMLITMDLHDRPCSRPMVSLDGDDDTGDLWFIVRDDSSTVSDIRARSDVVLHYFDPSSYRFVAVTGRAHVHRDGPRVRDMWHPSLSVAFPLGPDDPSIVLVHVNVDQVDFWESAAGPVQTLHFVKPVATIERRAGPRGTLYLH